MEEFIKRLKGCFEHNLPSEKAHHEMLHDIKKNRPENPDHILKAAKSSVLVLFYPKNDDIYTVFIERPQYDGVHSGQIALPGGKTEQNDKNLADTALREANEEIGIVKEKVMLIGNLSEVFVMPSNFLITPFVGIYNYKPQFSIDDKEVRKLIEIPFSEILKEGNKTKADVKAADGTICRAPCFKFEDNIIWGATAMILNELVYLWKLSD